MFFREKAVGASLKHMILNLPLEFRGIKIRGVIRVKALRGRNTASNWVAPPILTLVPLFLYGMKAFLYVEYRRKRT